MSPGCTIRGTTDRQTPRWTDERRQAYECGVSSRIFPLPLSKARNERTHGYRKALAAGSSKKQQPTPFSDRTANAFSVPKSDFEENAFGLSFNRYKEIVHEEVQYDPPKKILGRLKKLEAEIASDLEELEAMLG